MRRVLLAIAIVCGTATSAHAVSPIQPGNRPTPLPGVENGKVPASMLTHASAECVAVREAAPSIRFLFLLAQANGVSLDGHSCYRTLQGQINSRTNATANGNAACASALSTGPGGVVVGTSMHGWGKAADLNEAGEGLDFHFTAYTFMKAAAASVGWNHPGWAEPGGSSCPEPWHWEWVGDGGRQGLDTIRADTVAILPTRTTGGYWTVTGLGAVNARGNATSYGEASSIPIAWIMVSAQATPTAKGYWLVGGDGGVFSYGDAAFHGSTGGMPLNQPVLGMAPTPGAKGYWLVASDGGVFSFGNAKFYGSTGSISLFRPVVGMAAMPNGKGYWLAASDGGVFAYGDAEFKGSMGGTALAQPVLSIAATPSGKGYWLMAADGGIFNYGDAKFFGSGVGSAGDSPFVDIAATRSGKGYWLVRANGEVFAFGDAEHEGNG